MEQNDLFESASSVLEQKHSNLLHAFIDCKSLKVQWHATDPIKLAQLRSLV